MPDTERSNLPGKHFAGEATLDVVNVDGERDRGEVMQRGVASSEARWL